MQVLLLWASALIGFIFWHTRASATPCRVLLLHYLHSYQQLTSDLVAFCPSSRVTYSFRYLLLEFLLWGFNVLYFQRARISCVYGIWKHYLAYFIAGRFRHSSEQQSTLQTGKWIFLLKIKILLLRAKKKEPGASQRTPETSCTFHHRQQTNSYAKTKPGLRERLSGEPPCPSPCSSCPRWGGLREQHSPGGEWIFPTCPLQPEREGSSHLDPWCFLSYPEVRTW